MIARLAIVLEILAVLGLDVPAGHVMSIVRASFFFIYLTFLVILLLEKVHVGVFAIQLVLKFLDLLAFDWVRDLGLGLNKRVKLGCITSWRCLQAEV